jgi:hypothetical protein
MRSCLLLLFIAQVAFARHRIPSPHRRTFESRDRSLDTTPPFAERALADNIAALLGAPMNSLIAGISQAATALESLGFGPPDMAGIENGLGPGQDPDAVSRLEPDASGRRAEGNLTYYFVTNDFARGIYMLKSQDLNSIFADPSSEKQIVGEEELTMAMPLAHTTRSSSTTRPSAPRRRRCSSGARAAGSSTSRPSVPRATARCACCRQRATTCGATGRIWARCAMPTATG